jgi:putative protease
LLRIGYEDDARHTTVRVKRFVPARGRLHFNTLKGPPGGAEIPVFLIDRRSTDLVRELDRLSRLLDAYPVAGASGRPMISRPIRRRPLGGAAADMTVGRLPGRSAASRQSGVWLSPEALDQTPPKRSASTWWWLPPVLWPENQVLMERLIGDTRTKGGRNFVINAPWQAALFDRKHEVTLWAGPFCNLANPLSLEAVAGLGVAGAVVSPELGRQDTLEMPARSPLPLGIVLSGSWPLCISRILAEDAKTETLLVSPRSEGGWVRQYGQDYWVYPDWQLDLTAQKKELLQAGYRVFISLVERPPQGIRLKRRPGLWNWNVDLR